MEIKAQAVPKHSSPECAQPLLSHKLSAGFPSAADDFIDRKLDLNQHLVKHPSSTIFAWASGESLNERGVGDGDLLIIDRSLTPQQGNLVVAALDGEFTCKVYDKKNARLLSANEHYPTFDIAGREDVVIEGVIAYTIKAHF